MKERPLRFARRKVVCLSCSSASGSHIKPSNDSLFAMSRANGCRALRQSWLTRGVGLDCWNMLLAKLLNSSGGLDLAQLQMAGVGAPVMTISESARVREGGRLTSLGRLNGGVPGLWLVTRHTMMSSITAPALTSPTPDRRRAQTFRGLRGALNILQHDGTACPCNGAWSPFNLGSGAVLGVVSMAPIKGTCESALSKPLGITHAISEVHVKALPDRHP